VALPSAPELAFRGLVLHECTAGLRGPVVPGHGSPARFTPAAVAAIHELLAAGGNLRAVGGPVAAVGGSVAADSLHRGSSSEVLALVIGDQLVVGQTLLVEPGALLLEPGVGSFARCLLFGDPGSALGDLGLLGPLLRRLAMLPGGLITALIQFARTRSNASPFAGAHASNGQRDEDYHDNDDHNDHGCGHDYLLRKLKSARPKPVLDSWSVPYNYPVGHLPTHRSSGRRPLTCAEGRS